MATVSVVNLKNEKVGEVELDPTIFEIEPVKHLLHFAVRKQLAARRAGTHAVKGRSEVSGGGRKPFKQKGTGHARQGSIRAPHYRGGGVVFGPVPRSHDFKINKKVMALALRSALSTRARNGEIVVVESLEIDSYKTAAFSATLKALGLSSALLVDQAISNNLNLASRNLQQLSVLPSSAVNVYDVLRRDRLVLSLQALNALQARLGGAQ